MIHYTSSLLVREESLSHSTFLRTMSNKRFYNSFVNCSWKEMERKYLATHSHFILPAMNTCGFLFPGCSNSPSRKRYLLNRRWRSKFGCKESQIWEITQRPIIPLLYQSFHKQEEVEKMIFPCQSMGEWRKTKAVWFCRFLNNSRSPLSLSLSPILLPVWSPLLPILLTPILLLLLLVGSILLSSKNGFYATNSGFRGAI